MSVLEVKTLISGGQKSNVKLLAVLIPFEESKEDLIPYSSTKALFESFIRNSLTVSYCPCLYSKNTSHMGLGIHSRNVYNLITKVTALFQKR